LLVDSPESFNVQAVISNGELVAQDKKMIKQLTPPPRSIVLSSELKCKITSAEDFRYKVDIQSGTAGHRARRSHGFSAGAYGSQRQ
jgi:adenine deaminase